MAGACELVRLSASRHVGMLGCRMQHCIPRINTLGESVRRMKGMIIGSEELRPEDITLGVHTFNGKWFATFAQVQKVSYRARQSLTEGLTSAVM